MLPVTLSADDFLDAAAGRGINFYAGVPCSFLTPMINRLVSDPARRYVGAASEGEAVAIAAGAWLAGRGTAVMCQNSGLGDEPQHEVMGRITHDLLTLMGLGQAPFPADAAAVGPALDAAQAAMAETGLPYALVARSGTLADAPLDAPPRSLPSTGSITELTTGEDRPSRVEILERVLAAVPDTVPIVATTGKAGRELFTLADREQHLYQVGSMGGASPMGLGIALCRKGKTLVLDGDGAALMKLGSLATIGAYAPAGLVHVLLDNGVHDSTGGQATVSASVDFAGVAVACGYRAAFVCDDLPGFETAFARALAAPGPVLIHARIRPGSMKELGRPTVAPHEVAQRFRRFLQPGGRAAT